MRAFVLPGFILALALLVNSSVVSAQSSDEAAVVQAVEALRKAMIAKDRHQLEVLIADQLSFGHGDGRTETKTEYIDDVTSSRVIHKSIDFSNQSVKIVGDTAIVRHVYTTETERAGGEFRSTKLGMVLIWQKQDGRWRLLARQAYRI